MLVELTRDGVSTGVAFYLRDKNLSVYLCATSPSKSSFTIFRPRLYCLEFNQVCLTSSCGHSCVFFSVSAISLQRKR